MKNITRFFVFLTAIVIIVSGCATTQSLKGKNSGSYYVFESAPNIQYLTSFGSINDINPPSDFRKWIIGKDAINDTMVVTKPYGISAVKDMVYINDGRALSGYWVFDLKNNSLKLVRHQILSDSTGIAVDDRDYKFFVIPGMNESKARGVLGTKDEKGKIVVFDENNKMLKTSDFSGRPIDIAVFGDKLFVSDGINHRIAIVDKGSLEVVGEFGGPGSADAEFSFPKGVAVSQDGLVYVGDVYNGRIKAFTKDGEFVSQYGHRTSLLGGFLNLSGIGVDKDGRVYAVDSMFRKKPALDEVQIFDSGKFYANGENVPPIETKLEDRKNALLGYFQRLVFVEGSISQTMLNDPFYMPVCVTIDYHNVAYFQKYVAPGFRIKYLIWVTSQFSQDAKNVSVFGYIDKE